MFIDRTKLAAVLDPLVQHARPRLPGDSTPAIPKGAINKALLPLKDEYKSKGSRGESVRKALENAATDYLNEQGFTSVGRNRYCAPGEYFFKR